VLFDVGLGAGSNAGVAHSASESMSPHDARLHIVSFENDLGALALALDYPAAFGLEGTTGTAARSLLRHGRHETSRTTWELVHGDLLETLPQQNTRADIWFWDMYPPSESPEFWTEQLFQAAHEKSGERAVLFTYCAAKPVRLAMSRAGWHVGAGAPIGKKKHTTVAARSASDLKDPLPKQP